MKKTAKTLTVALLVLALLTGALAMTAAAAEVASGTSGDVSWTLTDDGTLTFSGEGAIGNDQSWIEHMDSITSIVIEDGITAIGNYAFYECAGFESVTLPASLTTIGNYAFTNCSDLKSVTIPASVTKIGNSVFYQCTSLGTVNYLGASEPTVGSYVFGGCSLTTANVPVDYEGDTFAGLSVSKTLVPVSPCDHADAFDATTGKCNTCDEMIAEASVKLGQGSETFCQTLTEALVEVESCTAGDAAVVKLYRDITGTTEYNLYGVFTLDLNGCTLENTVNAKSVLCVKGEVTVIDSGADGTLKAARGIYVYENAKLTVTDGSIVGVAYGMQVENDTQVTISGDAKISADRHGISADENVILSITGGSITAETAIHYDSPASITISGGIIKGKFYDNMYSGSAVQPVITGGSFPEGILLDSDGAFLPDILGEGCAYYVDGTQTAVAAGAKELSGNVTVEPCTHPEASFNDTTGACGICRVMAAQASVKLGQGSETFYQTLDEAFEAVASCTAENAAVVKLYSDVTGTTAYSLYGVFTLDLNGCTIENTNEYGDAIFVYDGVTVIDSGTDGALKAYCGIDVRENAKLTVMDGSIFGETYGIHVANNAQVTISGDAKIKSNGYAISCSSGVTLNVTGGSITANNYAIYYSSPASIRISGGTIEGEFYDNLYGGSAVQPVLTGGSFPEGIQVGGDGASLLKLLGESYAYYVGGTPTAVAAETIILSGNVTVKPCDHMEHTQTGCTFCGVNDNGIHTFTENSNGFCTVCDGYQPATGSGTAADPYQIGNAGQLYWFREVVNFGYGGVERNVSAHAKLTAHITINPGTFAADGSYTKAGDETVREWSPIGFNAMVNGNYTIISYKGTFDGQGYSITGLYFNNNTWSSVGLFGLIDGGTVKNVGVSNAYIKSGNYTGGIVGKNTGGNVENCFFWGSIISNDQKVGGVAGLNEGTVKNCYFIKADGFNENRSGIGYDNTTQAATDNGAAPKDMDAFKKGEVTYLLNENDGVDAFVWGQRVGQDLYPAAVTATNAIYRYINCDGTTVVYANSQKPTVHQQGVTAADRFTADGVCLTCGAQAPVMFTTAGETPVVAYYMSLDEAIQNTLLHPGATVMLLADVTLSEVITVNTDEENDTYNFVLDLNGKTIDNPNGGVFALSSQYGSAVNMRITDSSQEKAGRIIGNGMVITISARGDLAIDSVTIISGTIDNSNPSGYAIYKVDAVNSWSDNATVEISSGTFIGTVTASTGDVTGGSFTRISSEYLAKYHYAYDENGDIITYTSEKSLENCTVKKGADIAHIYTYLPNSTPYTGVPYNPVLRVSMCTDGLEEGTHYTVVVKNNEAVGTATFTFTGIAPFSGSFTKTVNITKGTLKVDTAPSATYSFGDDYTKAAIAGKVVVNGNTSLEIPGTWSWVDSTTAVFTPEAQYQDQFEALAAQTVAITVTPTTPVITLETPSPSILPGMSIQMTAVAKNPYNDTLTDLPTVFKLTYKVGENGAETTVDGLKFTLPSDATMGQTVYVWVTTEAVSGKYTAGQSDTIELLVGQVDYSQMLDDLTDRLEALEAEFGPDGEIEKIKADIQALKDDLDGYATDAELADAVSRIADLEADINQLSTTYATKTELREAIEALQNGDIATIQAAIAKINGILGTVPDDTTVAAELAQLADALSALTGRITASEGGIATNADAIVALRDDLDVLQATVSGLPTTAITDALSASIDNLNDELTDLTGRVDQAEKDIDNLEQAVEDLKTLIQTNADDIDEIEKRIATINETIEKMKADYATDAEVAAAIEKARQELSDEAQKFLADAETKLTEAFNKKADQTELEARVNELKSAIELAKQFATDEDVKLQQAIEAADGKLMQAIDKVKKDLDEAKSELQDAIDTKADADEIAAALEKLTQAVESAKRAATAGDAALKKKLADAEAELKAAIDKVADNLKKTKSSLISTIAVGDAYNSERISELEKALKTAIAASERADEETKAELTALIQEAKDALQIAVDKIAADLEKAQQELSDAIASGDRELNDKITALDAAMAAAIAANGEADEANKAQLKAAIEVANYTLQGAINKLSADLEKAQQELSDAIASGDKALKDQLAAQEKANQKELDDTKAELNAKDAQLRKTLIVATVIASVGVGGNIALVVWLLIKRKKVA